MNIGLGIGTRYPKFNQLSLALKAISAIRRNNGTLIGIPDNALGDGAPNLLSAPEFAGGLTDAPVRSGLVTASALAGYDGAIAFGHDGSTTSYAYKGFTYTNGLTYTLSVIVKMDDGNAPVFGSSDHQNSANSFSLVIGGVSVNPQTISVSAQVDGSYRLSVSAIAFGASYNTGVVKYETNNNRTFRVTGYKLELGSTATAYTPQSVLRQRGVYQDSAGITPVTAVGDVIGKLNDRVGTNNATQPTTASKPLVTRVPKRTKGPVNQLLYSQWGGGGTAPTGWIAFGAGGTEGALLPSGMRQRVFTSAASQDFIYQTLVLAANTIYTVAVAVDANPGNYTNGALVAYPIVPAGTTSSVASSGSVATPGGMILVTVTTSATAGSMLLRIGAGAQGATTGSVTLSAPAVFVGAYTAQQILDNGGIPLTTTQPLPNVLEWTNAISFDGSNDFLQTGITTGNEGWICSGVAFGAPLANNETVFSNGAGSATMKGVWLVRLAGSNVSSAIRMGIGNGTAGAQVQAPAGLNVLGTPRVVEGGWTASTVMVGVDGQTNSVARTGDATPAPNQPLIGAYLSGVHSLQGPMTAIIYTPVLPNAADRALIREWIGSLQGQTL